MKRHRQRPETHPAKDLLVFHKDKYDTINGKIQRAIDPRYGYWVSKWIEVKSGNGAPPDYIQTFVKI